jgi:hypothetical protein
MLQQRRFVWECALLAASFAASGCIAFHHDCDHCRRHRCRPHARQLPDPAEGIAACDAAAPILFHPVPTRPVFGPRADSKIVIQPKPAWPPEIDTLPAPSIDPAPRIQLDPQLPSVTPPSALGERPSDKSAR